MIGIETIGTNKYAPQGSEAVNLYSTGAEGGSGLTIGQLIIAVSMRSAAAYEAQSVVKMNAIGANSSVLDQASVYLSQVAAGSANWSEAKAFCVSSLGIAVGHQLLRKAHDGSRRDEDEDRLHGPEAAAGHDRPPDAREPPRRLVLGVVQHSARARQFAKRQCGEFLKIKENLKWQ